MWGFPLVLVLVLVLDSRADRSRKPADQLREHRDDANEEGLSCCNLGRREPIAGDENVEARGAFKGRPPGNLEGSCTVGR